MFTTIVVMLTVVGFDLFANFLIIATISGHQICFALVSLNEFHRYPYVRLIHLVHHPRSKPTLSPPT